MVDTVFIRTMKLEDYGTAYKLWLSCSGMGLNDVDDCREGIERLLRRNPETCFVAEHDGHIVGVLLAGNDGRRGYIYHTAVAPSCRNRGIGSQMVGAVLEAMRRLEISKVALVVFANNADGNNFWEKRKFSARPDITYRNRSLVAMTRRNT